MKYKIDFAWTSIRAVASAVATILIAFGCQVRAPINQTREELSIVYMVMINSEKVSKKPFAAILDERYPKVNSYNSKLADFLHSEGVTVRIRAVKNDQYEIVDEWGNLLLVYAREDAVKLNVDSKVIGDLSLTIWSSGPNGKNEFGGGDDVVVTDRFNK